MQRLGEAATRASRCVSPHATDLLRTRIQSELEETEPDAPRLDEPPQPYAIAVTANRRGIVVAAVSYYVVGLVGYMAKGVKEAGVLPKMLTPEIVSAVSVPIVMLVIWLMLHRMRKELGGGR